MYFVDVDKLNQKIIEHATTKEAIADEIGIGIEIFNRRLKSGKFLIGEIHKICAVLQLSPSEAKEIFLTNNFA